MAEKKKKVYEKARDWTIIVYPDSAPSNWRDILNDTYLRWIESPLHDKDLNADGTLKKPHWHILLTFEGPTTINTVKKIVESLNAPEPRKVGSAKGLVRYMAHLDNPEKYQYDISDIVGHNGADVQSYFELTATNKLVLMKEMISFIYENEIDNYADFLMICIEKSNDWFDIAVNSNTLALNKMIDAVWQKKNKK